MADKNYDILINIEARVQAIQEAVTQVQRISEAASTAQTALSQAFELGGAIEVAHRVADALREIPSVLLEGVKAGVDFQAKLQDITTGIAAVLRQTQPGRFDTFAAAKEQALEYIDTIKAAANRVGVTYEDMFEAVTHTQAQLSSAGVTDINQVIQTTQLLVQAMQAVGVSATQASRDIGDILQGNAARTLGGGRLAAAIGETKENFDKLIQSALQTGTLVTFLTERFGAFSDAIRDSSQNFNADVNRMKNALTDLEAEAAKPIMAQLQSGIDDAIDPEKLAQFLALARALGAITSAALTAAAAAVKLGEVIREETERFSAFLTIASKIDPVLGALNTVVQKVIGLQNQSADNQQLGDIVKDILGSLPKLGGAADQAGNKVAAMSDKMREALEKANLQAQILEDRLSKNYTALAFDEATLAVKNLRAEWEKTGPLTTAQEAALQRIFKDTQATVLAQQAHRDASAATKEEHQQLEALLRNEQELLQGIRANQQLINDNPFLSADQKQGLLAQSYKQESDALQKNIEDGQQYIELQKQIGGPESQANIQRETQELQKLGVQLVETGYKFETTNFTGQLRAELTQWVNQFGTAAHAAAQVLTGTLNAAISGTSQALTGLIFGTESWQQAFKQAAEAIVGNIITIVLEYTIGRAVMAAINSAFGGAETQATNTAAAKSAEAWAPAAVAASTASYGLASAVGLAAFLSSAALGAAGAAALSGAGGFSEGGFTGTGSPSEIAGFVHSGEYVFSKPAVDRLGVDTLSRFHTYGRIGGYAAGGFVSGGGSSGSGISALQPKISIFNLTDEKTLWDRYHKDSASSKFVVRTLNGVGGKFREV